MKYRWVSIKCLYVFYVRNHPSDFPDFQWIASGKNGFLFTDHLLWVIFAQAHEPIFNLLFMGVKVQS